ncbi:MAG TPA: S9 family peptidase [Candidatus Udaeobacter sp.]|jgi:dipeptidyl aminopeptidase/acylaminoacyl peptidase
MKSFLAALFLVATSALAQTPSQKHPFTFEDMMKLKRVGAPVPSPDGKWVVFDCVDVDLEANTNISHLWIVPANGGESRRLNPTPNHEERPRFSPDGKRLIWTSKATDPTQIWMGDFDSEGGVLAGKPRQVTNISTGAGGGIWSPDGKNIVFVSAVYPDCKDDECNKQRDEELKKSKVKAKIFTRLFYRHWNAFTEFKRRHLFVQTVEAPVSGAGNGAAAGTAATTAIDLTPGDHDVPPFSLGGQDMYAISPDGQEVAYTSNIDEVEATSTNNEIFTVQMNVDAAPSPGSNVTSRRGVASTAPKKISTSPGADTTPLYSPDGKYLAWRSQARTGFEADKWRLFVQDRQSGKTRDLMESLDRSIGSFTWSTAFPSEPASPHLIIFTAEDHGNSPMGLVSVDNPQKPAKLGNQPVHIDDLVSAGDSLFYTVASIQAPNEIRRYQLPPDIAVASEFRAVTHMNDALLSQIDMQPLESFTFKGANGDEVQGFVEKPPGFDPNKKYPLKFLLHGGPQGAWGNSWTYRWNAELFATTGNYVVVMINFHGSTGYGQKFTDSVSGDWGGKPYVDLMKGLDYVEKTYPFIDKNREAALGASYGGYMANWLLGHTNRFKCIVSHDGMFNAESAYGTTEELWFMNWEFGGPPWKKRDVYRKWSPHEYAQNFKTPTLVSHGQLDYRLDVSQGFDLFTTLQVLKVPSKMLYFPDEGHWVQKPQNSQLWYKTVNDWVDQWCK